MKPTPNHYPKLTALAPPPPGGSVGAIYVWGSPVTRPGGPYAGRACVVPPAEVVFGPSAHRLPGEDVRPVFLPMWLVLANDDGGRWEPIGFPGHHLALYGRPFNLRTTQVRWALPQAPVHGVHVIGRLFDLPPVVSEEEPSVDEGVRPVGGVEWGQPPDPLVLLPLQPQEDLHPKRLRVVAWDHAVGRPLAVLAERQELIGAEVDLRWHDVAPPTGPACLPPAGDSRSGAPHFYRHDDYFRADRPW